MNFKALLPVAMLVAVGCGGADGVGLEKPAEIPQWLLGTYSRGTRVENSVTVESENRGVRFEPGNHYRYKSGAAWSVAVYDVKATPSSVLFLNGPLLGKQLSLTSVSSNCRIVQLDGESLFRDGAVAGCPMRENALTANACDSAGVWRKTSRTGSLDTELFEMSVRVSVDADGFFMRTQASTTCHAGHCRYDEALPQVGTWSDAVSADLFGFEHVAVAGCVQPVAEPLELETLPLDPVVVALPTVTFPEPLPTAYGRCSSDAQCTTGRCGEAGTCTARCKYDVECASPGEGMIASCRSNACVATCATGNACPGGTTCHDGLCN